MSKVIISRSPDQLKSLAKAVLAKHATDGASSPLSLVNMSGMQTCYDKASEQHEKAQQLYRDAAKATENRDLALGIHDGQNRSTPETLTTYLAQVRDVLLGIYRGNDRTLGDWGFEVVANPSSNNDTPPPANPT
jgi:hypothetical protein